MGYTMSDYRELLDERDSFDFGSKEWDAAQQKVQQVVEAMVKSGSKQMVSEVVEEVYSLNDCGATLEDEAVKNDIRLLGENGFATEAEELKSLEWK